MAFKWGELVGALLSFIVFVAFPLIAIRFIPAQTLNHFTSAGFDVQSLLTQLALYGLVISTIALAKVFTKKTSLTYLILDVSSNLVSLIFALLIIGVGNIGSLGLSNFRIVQGKVTAEILLDLRVFIWLTLGVVTISVLQSIAKFREAKAEENTINQSNPDKDSIVHNPPN